MKTWIEYPLKVSRKRAAQLVAEHLILASMFFEATDAKHNDAIIKAIGIAAGDTSRSEPIEDAAAAFIASLERHYETLAEGYLNGD